MFNVLGYAGFLRGQGVLTLEVVQEFYRLIGEKPKPATTKVSNLLDFCPTSRYCDLETQPVISLVKEYSDTGEKYHHVVLLYGYSRDDQYLTLYTFDSLSETGETSLACQISTINGKEKLELGGETDQWCLGSEICYALYLK